MKIRNTLGAGLFTAVIIAILRHYHVHYNPAELAALYTGLLGAAHVQRRHVKRTLPKRYRLNPSLGLWVWNATDPHGHIARCKQYGYGWICVKVHDGSYSYGNESLIKEYALLAHKAGIKFGVWGYCRSPYDTWRASFAIKKYAAHFYIADVEVEFERMHRSASLDFIRMFDAKCDKWLSSFGRIDLHPDIDWHTWEKHGWGFMPQAYSCDSSLLRPAACMRAAEAIWPRHRIQPTLGAYAGARGRLSPAELAGECRGLGLSGANVWEAGTATAEELAAVSRVL